MAIANAADTLKMSILQFNKHPFRLTKTRFQKPHWAIAETVGVHLNTGKMTNRDKIFIWTASIIFVLTWVFMTAIMDGAQAVGDAELDFNPKIRATALTLVITALYSVFYYAIYWLVKIIRNLVIKKPRTNLND